MVDVLLGLQWGDEGKGKIVDYLAGKYDIVARFQGGPNAGHTLIINGKKHVLHTIPSGIFHEKPLNLIGNGVVIDPITLKREIETAIDNGVDIKNKLFISKKASLIMPTHKTLDAASEHSKGKAKIGSTLRGITPTYMDKTGRNGLKIGDSLLPDFKEKYEMLKAKHYRLLSIYDFEYDITEEEKEWFAAIEYLKSLTFVESEYFINNAIAEGKKILAEGAQGTMLDIDFGTYPYVTSSNTITAAACTGLGIAPNKIGEVIGITKAYCTRVGAGPFPTELEDDMGQKLRDQGHEYGATTGRPRRCGWIDLPALNYTIMINGVTQLVVTKIDVMDNFESISACTSYTIDGNETKELPHDLSKVEITPNFKPFEGWQQDINDCNSFDQLPSTLTSYIGYLENYLNVKVSLISNGPEREKLIFREASMVDA